MTPEFEAKLKKAVEDGDLPNAVLLARDKSGKIDYTFCVGQTSLEEGAPPITPTTLLTMASLTKLLTTCCLLNLIQHGILDLDEPVTMYLPTLEEQPILTGFDDAGKPTFKPRAQPMTLRHLLTHTAGTGYLYLDERLMKWAEATGFPLPMPLRHSPLSGGRSVDSRFGYPLLFEPGEGWVYGSGLDWAGRLIEKMTGSFFDDFLHENVLRRVGVPHGGITFHPGRFGTPPVDVLAGMAKRDEATGKVVAMPEMEYDNDNEAFGGEGCFGGLGEYMKVLYSLLMDDGRILDSEHARLLFEPLLQPEEKKALHKALEHPEWAVGPVPEGVDYDWSAGGLMTNSDNHEHRRKGFLQWSGAWNLYWFIDREAGVCGVFGTQINPPSDPTARAYMKEFEELIYAKAKN
ncbi:beta-lactamase/transpeptidase-like protein [Parathielavia hyrcaniae]|uniref:Beta-lactamase/transpeptidase-like protein n=1 Tax=Parathielavia hyrcaniae TaxID=113614 RepID=A0AAN6Q8A6_9PEZI|nr:beta-lactamase/transpeptidase-like protein [Parathielavia hyrcaniae]